jgi:hypothetical protein
MAKLESKLAFGTKVTAVDLSGISIDGLMGVDECNIFRSPSKLTTKEAVQVIVDHSGIVNTNIVRGVVPSYSERYSCFVPLQERYDEKDSQQDVYIIVRIASQTKFLHKLSIVINVSKFGIRHLRF